MSSLDISSEEFRRLASQVVELSAQYLKNLDRYPILPASGALQTEQLFHSELPEKGLGADALLPLREVMAHSRIQNGRFLGYVLGSGEPVAAIADLLASVLNQNVTAWRSAPAAVSIERTVVQWLAEAIGCKGLHGSLTGGGSAANLMALTMAREAKLAANEHGLSGRTPGVVYASEEVHMSIPKSIALLGMGRSNLRLIAVDETFRLKPKDLDRAIQSDKAAGKTPLAVVASAGTVNTGAIDPLKEIAAVARHHDLWFHVDGAYGALAAIAVPEKFSGMALADSISLDPHKWLYQPLDCGCLLYRDASSAQKTFAHTGDYAKTLSADPVEGFAFFEESIELSRRFRALKLWLSLRYHGLQAFRAAIRKNLDLTRRLEQQISLHPELELLAPLELSAVCFRYKGDRAISAEDLDQLNTALLKRIQQRGRVYLSNATLRGKFALRACVTNHRTTEADVDCVVEEVLAASKEI